MTFVILETQDGTVTGQLHQPSERRPGATTWGGSTFARYSHLELPYHWPALCGTYGVVYLNAPVIRERFTPCLECRDAA